MDNFINYVNNHLTDIGVIASLVWNFVNTVWKKVKQYK